MQKSPSIVSLARDRELGADEHHVHRQPAAALLDEQLSAGAQHLRGGAAPRRVGLEKGPEALGVDADALAHRLELLVALDRASEVELEVARDDAVVAALQRAVVAHGHRRSRGRRRRPAPSPARGSGRAAIAGRGRRRPARRSRSSRARRRSAPRSGRRSTARPRAAAARTRSGGRSGSPRGTSRHPRSRCTRCRRRSARRGRRARARRARCA